MAQVHLLAATEPLLNALVHSRALFGELVGSPVPDGWPELPEAIGFTLEHLRAASDADRPWSMQLFVDPVSGRLLGSGGFAAPPAGRTVEIGYEIAPEFRGRGFGATAARALVEHAVATACPEEFHAAVVQRHPLGPLGQPEEVSHLVCFLLSEEASLITGGYYLIDGGCTAV